MLLPTHSTTADLDVGVGVLILPLEPLHAAIGLHRKAQLAWRPSGGGWHGESASCCGRLCAEQGAGCVAAVATAVEAGAEQQGSVGIHACGPQPIAWPTSIARHDSHCGGWRCGWRGAAGSAAAAAGAISCEDHSCQGLQRERWQAARFARCAYWAHAQRLQVLRSGAASTHVPSLGAPAAMHRWQWRWAGPGCVPAGWAGCCAPAHPAPPLPHPGHPAGLGGGEGQAELGAGTQQPLTKSHSAPYAAVQMLKAVCCAAAAPPHSHRRRIQEGVAGLARSHEQVVGAVRDGSNRH